MATSDYQSTTGAIGQLLTQVVQAFVAIVDGFVTVLENNAQAIAELSIVGALLYGATKVFGRSISGLKSIVGF
ncbi:MAG: hypothetical protein GXO43_02235 [Crenarchaeota archaeon]|nr:hypothetical protein [Thermoproteota archaeon]